MYSELLGLSKRNDLSQNFILLQYRQLIKKMFLNIIPIAKSKHYDILNIMILNIIVLV